MLEGSRESKINVTVTNDDYELKTAFFWVLLELQGKLSQLVLHRFVSCRSFQGAETYLVVMNLGSEYETVDLSGLQVIKQQHLLVHTSSVNSEYSTG